MTFGENTSISAVVQLEGVIVRLLIGEQKVTEECGPYLSQLCNEKRAEIPVNASAVRSRKTKGAEAGQNDGSKHPLVSVEQVDGSRYHGYLLIVRDPKKIKLVVPDKKDRGEKVSSMVKRTGAIAGVNAGGFADRTGKATAFSRLVSFSVTASFFTTVRASRKAHKS